VEHTNIDLRQIDDRRALGATLRQAPTSTKILRLSKDHNQCWIADRQNSLNLIVLSLQSVGIQYSNDHSNVGFPQLFVGVFEEEESEGFDLAFEVRERPKIKVFRFEF
jgi:hypothetical protein